MGLNAFKVDVVVVLVLVEVVAAVVEVIVFEVMILRLLSVVVC